MTERRRKLKVYGGNLNGNERAIMACHSLKEFMAATRIGRDWVSETWNEEETKQAMAEPGVVFKRPYSARGGTLWQRLK
jgi:hypothetical protein